MSDLQATLDAIDQLAVHQCGYCSRPLSEDSESLDYCSDVHQAAWLAERHEVAELVGYREPYDLPQYQSNLLEMHSPETSPPTGDLRYELYPYTRERGFGDWGSLVRFMAGVEPFRTSLSSVVVGMADLINRHREELDLFHTWSIVDEIHNWQPTDTLNEPMAVSLTPAAEEPFGSDFDFEHRPARSLPHAPPPAVMPALPDRDWQALVDSRIPHTGPVRVSRAPCQLGRTR